MTEPLLTDSHETWMISAVGHFQLLIKLLSVLYQGKNRLGFRKTTGRAPLSMLATTGEVLSTSAVFI